VELRGDQLVQDKLENLLSPEEKAKSSVARVVQDFYLTDT
jgi:hypothetical protein